MKKLTVLLMTLILSFSLLGCKNTKTIESVSTASKTRSSAEPANVPSTTTTDPAKFESEKEPSRTLGLDDYHNIKIGDASFDIPITWTRVDSDDTFYFYEGSTGSVPFFMFQYAYIEYGLDFDSVPWSDFVSGVGRSDYVAGGGGITDYKIISKSSHKFAKIDLKMIVDGDKHYSIMYSTYENNMLFTIAITTVNFVSDDSYYGSILEHIADSLVIGGTEPAGDEETTKATTTAADSATANQRRAVDTAKNYLSFTHFSHSGLVNQLKYEGFTDEDAKYGADNSGANWMEQTVKSAESYLDIMSMMRAALIDQLIYEGFTREQTEYGATQNGL